MFPKPTNRFLLRRTACAAVLPFALLIVAPASAHDEQLGSPEAAAVPQSVAIDALGGNAEPVGDTLYEVDVAGGPDLLTHGPDLQLDAAQERSTGFSAGDPERPPVCATDTYQQILYGHLATAPDRLASVKDSIRSQMMRTNALLNQESLDSGGPTADYKMLCDSSGQIDVQGFTATGATFSEVVAGARTAGFDDPNVDYTVFFDDPTSSACGVGSYYNDERLIAGNRSNNGGGFGVAYSDCWFGSTPMHENGHNQGAVQRGAPYSTGTGGHCWDEEDVMCYAPDGGDLHQEGTIDRCTDRIHFDCGFDTYFDSAPEPGEYLATHWNIGSSLNRFLAFDSGNVTVANTTPGAGFEFSCTVTSCQFSDTSSDSDGTIIERQWDFGDGSSASDGAPSHTFAEDGSYPVTLLITDDDGSQATTTREVTVGGAPSTLQTLRAGARRTAKSGVSGSWDFYSVNVKRGTRTLQTKLAGPDCRMPSCDPDLDLYVRRGSKPNFDAFTCRPRLVGSNESCKIAKPRPGKWIVGVYVYDATTATQYSVSAKAKKPGSKR